jgi:imidazolonepropionase
MFVVRNIGVLCTMDGPAGDVLGRVEHAALVASDDLITWTGPEKDLPPIPAGTRQVDAEGGALLPGLVECHTHLVFAGTRVADYARRSRGMTYQQIAAEGGGIITTVKATRDASESDLVDLALPRLKTLLRHGVTTCEVKSGYGLTLQDELKILRAVRVLGALQPVELVPTFLGAHVVAPEFRENPDRYVDLVCAEMIPQVAEARLARFADVFVEQGAFTPAHARRIAKAASDAGLGMKLHVDQLSDGSGAGLAAELGCVSADHLDHATPAGIAQLQRAGTVAVLLPSAQVFLGHAQKAPARALLDGGVPVAISTDFNPGTSPCLHPPLAGTLAVGLYGMSVDEVLLGLTRQAAAALGRKDLGRFYVGAPCDALLLKHSRPEDLLYEMAGDPVAAVIKAGRVVYRDDPHRLPN